MRARPERLLHDSACKPRSVRARFAAGPSAIPPPAGRQWATSDAKSQAEKPARCLHSWRLTAARLADAGPGPCKIACDNLKLWGGAPQATPGRTQGISWGARGGVPSKVAAPTTHAWQTRRGNWLNGGGLRERKANTVGSRAAHERPTGRDGQTRNRTSLQPWWRENHTSQEAGRYGVTASQQHTARGRRAEKEREREGERERERERGGSDWQMLGDRPVCKGEDAVSGGGGVDWSEVKGGREGGGASELERGDGWATRRRRGRGAERPRYGLGRRG